MPHAQTQSALGPTPFSITLVAPSDSLTDLINTFFVIDAETGEFDEHLPAYSAQLLVFARGKLELFDETGQAFASEPVTITAPLMQALRVRLSGPATILGASLTPLGWQCLSGLPADRVNNCTVPSRQILSGGAKTLETLCGRYKSGAVGEGAIFDAIGAILETGQGLRRQQHADFIAGVMDWLNSELSPPVDALYESLSFSSRTVQRLMRRYFGVSPTRLVKRYRAIRAAMLLSNPDLPQVMRDEIRNSYFDQAHLIRDIRRYTGRTPTSLSEPTILRETLAPQAHGETASLIRDKEG